MNVGAVQLYSSGSTRDPGVLRLELADLLVQRVDRLLGHAGAQRADDDRDRLVLGPGSAPPRPPRWARWRAACDGAVLVVVPPHAATRGGDDGEGRQDRRRASGCGPHRCLLSLILPTMGAACHLRLRRRSVVRRRAEPSSIVVRHPPRWLRRLAAVRPQPDRRVGREVAVRDVGTGQQDRPMGRQRHRGAGQVGDVHEVGPAREREDLRVGGDPRRAARPRGPGSARRMRSAAR